MSEELVNIEINGKPFQARKGSMLIQVADENGIYIPRFCYHDKLSVAANCRMCLVEVEKAPKPLPACATPVGDGMKVFTKSKRAIAAQKNTMEFLLINHPLDCPVCDQGGECELQDLAMGYGRGVSRYQERKRVVKDKDIGPLISTDMTRCIHCTRCVRFGTEVAGMRELGATGRGENMRIGTYIERSVKHELSGNVIDLCPVGALNSKPFRMRARSWEMTQASLVSPHDAVGSNLFGHVLRGRLMRIVPRRNEAVNETWISDRDRFSYEAVNSPSRIERPRMKRDGDWQDVEWETALERAADQIRRALQLHGPESVGVLVSSNATLEEGYLAARLARGLGVSNLDFRLRQSDFRDQAADPVYPSLGRPLEEFASLDAGLVIGANVRKDAPLFGHRLRQAALKGAKLSFLGARAQEYMFPVHQYLTAGDSAAALAGVVKALAELAGKAAPKHLKGLVDKADAGDAHKGVAQSLLDGESSSVVLGPEAQRDAAFADLRALAAAAAELSGATLGYLTEGANAAGLSLAGVLPHRTAGGDAIAEPGLDAAAMLREPRKLYILVGVEPEYDTAWPAAALDAMRQADDVLCLSPFATEAMAEYASVMLPTGTLGETAGTFVNGEGRWQSFTGASQPVGESRPAWKVLRVLGNLLELDGFEYMSADEVANAVKAEVGGPQPDNAYTGSHAPESAKFDGLRRVTEISIYATDALVRRAASLQATHDAEEGTMLRLAPATAEKLGLGDGDTAVVKQLDGEARLPVCIDAGVAESVALVPGGVTATVGFGEYNGAVEIARG